MKRDAALRTAREILARSVCECGHMGGDHIPASAYQLGECADCDCGRFKPVKFRVERA
jgi:hypothetical protein